MKIFKINCRLTIRLFFYSWQEEAALKEEQEKERRRRAQEKFKEWLSKANEKSKSSPKSPCYQKGKVISVIWKLSTMFQIDNSLVQ